jgi:hypothetical protein
MKRILILTFFASFGAFGQSASLIPTTNLVIKKNGIGLDARNLDNTVGIGTYVDQYNAYFQTHTNHSLNFTTGNGSAKMTLLPNGNLGIGTATPTAKLHVVGNALFTEEFNGQNFVTNTIEIGNGATINKYFKVVLTGQQITSVPGNGCSSQFYTVAGVGVNDIVIMNIDNPSTNLSVASVRANGTDTVAVKFCNADGSSSALETGKTMRFSVFK